MHLVDGLLNTSTILGTSAFSVGAVGYALRSVGNEGNSAIASKMGVMAAATLSAQMVNFPLLPATSGHLMGSTLAAVMLGPRVAVLTMALVTIVQALVLADGGVTVLGANILNLAVVQSLVGYAIWSACASRESSHRRVSFAAGLSAFLAVVVSAASCGLQIALSNQSADLALLVPLVGVHSLIGLIEGVITASTVGYLFRAAPEQLQFARANRISAIPAWSLPFAGGALIVAVILILVSPWGSSLPDGLQSILERFRIGGDSAESWTGLAALGPRYTGIIAIVLLGGLCMAIAKVAPRYRLPK